MVAEHGRMSGVEDILRRWSAEALRARHWHPPSPLEEPRLQRRTVPSDYPASGLKGEGSPDGEGGKADSHYNALILIAGGCDNSCTVSARQSPSPITDPLRRAIVESGASYKSLSRETGVTRASIQRFVDDL